MADISHSAATPNRVRRSREPAKSRRLRLRFFWYWVAATVVVGGIVALAGPITDNLGAGSSWVALAVPATMILLLAGGIAWFVSYATTTPRFRHRTPQQVP